jgi:putative oxidoreductase
MRFTHDLGLLLLRLAGLGLALAHGWGKLERFATGQGGRFVEGVAKLGFPQPELFGWAAALSEFAGGILVTLGLGTRVAACFAAFTMGVAAFVRHRAHEHLLVVLGARSATPETLEAWGDPEGALLYLAAFLAIALLGPGRFALDALWGRRGKR